MNIGSPVNMFAGSLCCDTYCVEGAGFDIVGALRYCNSIDARRKSPAREDALATCEIVPVQGT